jgi:Na+/glutamate symporter
MQVKTLALHFLAAFLAGLVAAVLVTFFWNLIFHSRASVDWIGSLRLAVIIALALTLMKLLEVRRDGRPRDT